MCLRGYDLDYFQGLFLDLRLCNQGLVFGSLVKVRITVSGREMNVGLCNFPKSDIYVCVCVCLCVCT